MDNVQFDENQQAASFNRNFTPKVSLVTRLIMKLGLAKDQKQANNVMIVISVISLALMSYFLISTYAPNLFNFSRPEEAESLESIQQRLDALRNGAVPTPNQ